MSKNISYLITAGLAKVTHTHTVRTNYQCKLGTYCGLSMNRKVAKTENVHTHPPVVELVGCDTHTHIPSSYLYTVCDSPPWAEHKTPQLVAISRPVRTIAQHKAMYCRCYTASCFWMNKKALQWSCFVCVRFPSISTWKFHKMCWKKSHVELLSWRPISNLSHCVM